VNRLRPQQPASYGWQAITARSRPSAVDHRVLQLSEETFCLTHMRVMATTSAIDGQSTHGWKLLPTSSVPSAMNPETSSSLRRRLRR
jgi:hypothetical protein